MSEAGADRSLCREVPEAQGQATARVAKQVVLQAEPGTLWVRPVQASERQPNHHDEP